LNFSAPSRLNLSHEAPYLLAAAAALAAALTMGCSTLDERQRAWIFQPSDRAWGGSADLARDMQEVWIPFQSKVTGEASRLHGLWLPAERGVASAPVLLYLHGARWNVEGSAPRIRRMQQLGFSVLAIDYRGFGKSSPACPRKRRPTRTPARPGTGWPRSSPSGRATSSATPWAARSRSTSPPRSTTNKA
jgi:acetyl esterase/lipase